MQKLLILSDIDIDNFSYKKYKKPNLPLTEMVNYFSSYYSQIC